MTRLGFLLLFPLLGAFFVLGCGAGSSGDVDLIPREVLFGNPEKAGPQVSPDGTKMAYVAPVDGVLNVWVGSIAEGDYKPVTRDTDRGIRGYFFAKDNKHLLYVQDKGGDENWRLYAVNLETGDIRDLTPFEGVQAQIVDLHKDYPDEILIGLNMEDPRLHDVYHLTISTGELNLVAKNPGNIIGWQTDADFTVRGALAANMEGGFDLLVRESLDDEWEKILTWSSEDNMNSEPVAFSKDGGSMYLLDSRNANAARLVLMDLATKEFEVIAEDPVYDVGGVMLHPDEYTVQAYAIDRDRTEWTVVDDAIREDWAIIERLHPGDHGRPRRNTDDDVWVVGFTADDGPVKYYMLDRKTKQTKFLFDHKPDLNDYTLAKMEPIEFTSRDGLTIHGYATFPPGKGRRNLPMVLNVHGGPWHRDGWGYNPEAQWIANRGYLCLQVNFRGSTGYGKEFLNAGDKEWGGKMHDDLVDAVNWAVEQGYADPEKVAIYGGSYGGYAALVGATFTPELFCCAVDIVGPSNLITFINTIPPYWSTFLEVMYKRVGNPETDKEFLESRSPLFKVNQIQIPMLIAQGANDPRVNQAESEQIVAALKDKGIEYEYMLFPDEGHGFAKPENRLKFYAAAEAFLAKHLGGRFEPAAEAPAETPEGAAPAGS
ncbi:MAG: S9 family peptidase [Candidatus Eisenbacteria bacterium]|nr:S9 family peptidase [Candidatus Eisenbacteria bacterium]